MRKLVGIISVLLLALLAVLSCGESSNPFETERTIHEPAAFPYEHATMGSAGILSDDFEGGLDTSLWYVEQVGNAEWVHMNEEGNGFIRSQPQNPWDWNNRMTDILTHRDDFDDFTFTWDMRFQNQSWHKDHRYVYFRSDDSPNVNGYLIHIGVWIPTIPDHVLQILKVNPNGSYENLHPNISYPWVLDQWYSFKLEVSGSMFKLKVWVKGDMEPVTWTMETLDPLSTYIHGRIGFGNYWEAETDVDNVVVIPLVHEVDLDIKPGACPNPLNTALFKKEQNAKLKDAKGGVLPVAILGTEYFDINDIDVSTIELGGIVPIRHSYEDVATPVLNGGECDCNIDGPDGYLDLTLKFRQADIVSVLGSVSVGDVIPLEISGMLLDGTPFEGVDCVWIVGKERELAPL